MVKVHSNLKGLGTVALGQHTVLMGESGTRKTATVQAVELALTGGVNDAFWRDSVRDHKLLQLADGGDSLWSEVTLSDGTTARAEGAGRMKRVGPSGVIVGKEVFRLTRLSEAALATELIGLYPPENPPSRFLAGPLAERWDELAEYGGDAWSTVLLALDGIGKRVKGYNGQIKEKEGSRDLGRCCPTCGQDTSSVQSQVALDAANAIRSLKAAVAAEKVLADALHSLVMDAGEDSLVRWLERANIYLPSGWTLSSVGLQCYLNRGEGRYGALSGGETAVTGAALGAALGEVSREIPVLVPEDRQMTPVLLRQMLGALQRVPFQVIVTTTHRPQADGWTMIDCDARP